MKALAGQAGSGLALEPSIVLAARLSPLTRTPVWFMRQAGRSLPEYRKLREDHGLFEICQTPELCAEVTLQPVRRLGVDAAVLFADIMLPVKFGLGVDVRLVEEVGPVIDEPVRSSADVERLRGTAAAEAVPFVLETVRIVRRELPSAVGVIGFSGAPFTIAGYLIEGRPSRDFAGTKRLMFSEPLVWGRLMDRLTEMVIDYLLEQGRAGADLVQLFDSWVGALSVEDYRRSVYPWMTRIFEALERAGLTSVHFGTGCSHLLQLMCQAGGDVIGLDWRVDLAQTWEQIIGLDRGVQGNLDPAVLLAPWETAREAAAHILERVGGRPGHIFNLGHGVHPDTPVEHLQKLVELVHGS
jgi:uroporphyrinogen decarboxylase